MSPNFGMLKRTGSEGLLREGVCKGEGRLIEEVEGVGVLYKVGFLS